MTNDDEIKAFVQVNPWTVTQWLCDTDEGRKAVNTHSKIMSYTPSSDKKEVIDESSK